MVECPNCGAPINEQASICGACGTSLNQGNEQGEQPRQGQGQSRRSQQSQPQQGQGQPTGQPQHGQSGTYQHPKNDDDFVAGLSRRQVVAAGAGIAVLGGGAFLLTGGGPKPTAREFLNALDEGNAEKANSLIHPDSPMGDVSKLGLALVEEINYEIQSLSVEENTGDEAVVEAELELSKNGRSETSTTMIVLRKHDGEWKVYSFG